MCLQVPLPSPYLPEPVDLLAVLGVMPVDGVLLPVGQIDLLHPTQHQLQQTKTTFTVQPDVLNPASLHDSSGDRGRSGTAGQGSANSRVCPLLAPDWLDSLSVLHCWDVDSFRWKLSSGTVQGETVHQSAAIHNKSRHDSVQRDSRAVTYWNFSIPV